MILSSAVTLSAGEGIFLPLTTTRPASISRSASRREHTPARAKRLAIRSPSMAGGNEGFEDFFIGRAYVVFRVPLHAEAKRMRGKFNAFDHAVGSGGIDDR